MPSNISLRHLTELLIPLMGWENEHLNQIIQGQETFYVPFYQHDPDCDWGDHRYQEEYMLSDLLREKGMTVRWEYDFGDGWQHEIRLSSISEYEADEPRAIIFKSGKYVCPPEDCGGIWGYQDLLDLHAKRKAHKRLTSDEKERLEWYGIDKDYDPEEDFDKDECIDICDEFSCNDDSDALIATRAKTPSQIGGKQSGSINDDVDPFITSPLYDEVLSLAFRLRELEPWEDLDDSDVYAIRMQDGSEMYIATMGNGSGMKDIQFYDGAESFQQYLCYLNGPQLLHFDIMDLHCWANYTSILFPDAMEKAADAAYYTHIKQWADTHNKTIKPECGYPLLQRYRPHRYQSMMLCDEQGLARLKEALEAVLWLSQQLLDTDDLATLGFVDGKYPTKKGGKVVPLVIKTSEGYRIERTKLPGLCEDFPTVSIPESDLQSLRTLRKSGTQYCRLIHIPELIDSEDDRENSNFPLILACIDKNQDIASMTEPCEMSNDYERDVLRQYINKVREEGKLPQRIVTDHPRTYAFLRDFCHTLGTILELKRVRIPELNELCQYMCEFKL
ncbi:MAG: plasmid pRiA4b ORF-3 family protein [Bacteroidales bacterium]|nr:plasmid pRiA4b ORF-3 family protein [Candidatus Equimonas faecalis]